MMKYKTSYAAQLNTLTLSLSMSHCVQQSFYC
jgi:hypothetical protein